MAQSARKLHRPQPTVGNMDERIGRVKPVSPDTERSNQRPTRRLRRFAAWVLREHRGDTKANRVACLARLRAEVSVQTPSTHFVLAEVLKLLIDPRSQPAKWRQPVVSQRCPDRSARHLSVALKDLESKCFLRSEMVRKGPQRHPGSLCDVAHA